MVNPKKRRRSSTEDILPAAKKVSNNKTPTKEETSLRRATSSKTVVTAKPVEVVSSVADRVSTPTLSLVNDILHRNDAAFTHFVELLDSIESSSPSDAHSLLQKASLTLMKLRSLQRDLYKKKSSAEKLVLEKRRLLQQRQLEMANLEYEQRYLQQQLISSRKHSTPQLARMARDELDLIGKEATVSDEEVVIRYLGDATHNHEAVVQKLHQELNTRGNLERNLNSAREKLQHQQSFSSQRQHFLSEFPKKLDILERASLPLQKFFQSNRKGYGSKGQECHFLERIGTERSKRLELAKNLPGPLYTLYCHMQSSLDHFNDGGKSMGVLTATNNKSHVRGDLGQQATLEAARSRVQLSFPIPEIPVATTTGKAKRVQIEFSFLSQYTVVVARATSPDSHKLNASTLLSQVFPHDDGNYWIIATPPSSTEEVGTVASAGATGENVQMLIDKATQEAMEKKLQELPGKPYHWCNYIAGVHLLTPSSMIPISTRSVMDALARRVQSNATLTQLLYHLEKRKPSTPPVHQSMAKEFPESTVKLSSFSKKSPGHYQATLKGKGTALRATVHIDYCRYPMVPPVWSLQQTLESALTLQSLADGTNPLYDNDLGQMEQQVNDGILEQHKEASHDDSNDDVHDWLLVHQLSLCMKLWESQRKHKGRSRV